MHVSKLLLAFLFSFNLSAMSLDVAVSLNGTDQMLMEAGQPADLTVKYTNPATSRPFTMFMKMHAKLQHMVVISRDLTHFAHIHPEWNKRSRQFELKLNSATTDFDNQMLPTAIPFGGEYMVFSEVMAMDGTEHFMQADRFMITADGAPTAQTADTYFPDASMPVVKYYNLDGSEGVEGSALRITLTYDMLDFCNNWFPKFYFDMAEFVDGKYVAATDFTPWLEMGGHAVLLSADDVALKDRRFHHLHAFLPIGTPGEFTFPYDDHLPPLPAGHYKIWSQYLYKGQLVTASFAFEMQIPTFDTKCKSSF
ncbi:MAG: hypothetical protein COW78_01655 [Bdellovibrio sp. CG22_combo_CG10-13_8_21_14_all_39_27]|nr:MAG: hypothetical protein COW78_01655 [Bdellovibrio sp. CG22_combo_CG10-13_8_21_14_all_39_27]